MKVICIDDEYLILHRTASLLRKFPQIESVECFMSGRDALEYMKNHSVDAAFMDINMPEINGLELAEIIQNQYKKVEIVFLTAYFQFALDAYKMHVSGYLLKPVDEEQLLEQIQKMG